MKCLSSRITINFVSKCQRILRNCLCAKDEVIFNSTVLAHRPKILARSARTDCGPIDHVDLQAKYPALLVFLCGHLPLERIRHNSVRRQRLFRNLRVFHTCQERSFLRPKPPASPFRQQMTFYWPWLQNNSRVPLETRLWSASSR